MQIIDILSSITLAESIQLQATLNAIDDDRFNCQKCQPNLRQSKFCTQISQNVIHHVGGYKFKKCPGNWFSYQGLNYLEWHHAFETYGTLPYTGSLSEQPNKIIEIFRVITEHKSTIREKMYRKSQLEVSQRRGARG